MFLGGVLGDSTGDVLKESSETEVMESRIHVLLVDDDTLARHVVSKALEKFGYQVTVVANAQQALQVLESSDVGTFQLILSDVVMPEGGDGLDLLEQLKSNSAWTSIPVVSALQIVSDSYRRECLQHGACHYIVKPATHKEIKNIWQYAFRGCTVAPHPCTPRKGNSSDAALSPLEPSAAVRALTMDTGRDSIVDASAAHLAPHHLTPTSSTCPLNSVLESTYLPWNTRLTIFCNLLHSSVKASMNSVSQSSRVYDPAAFRSGNDQPFVCPASVLVSCSGDVSSCSLRSNHFSTPFYRAPEHRSANATALQGFNGGSKRYCFSEATYALGVLLMELAMAPVTAADRAKHLAALPRLPAQLLTSKPKIAVLILQMTAEAPKDRPQLQEVAVHASIAEVYSMVAAQDSAAAMSAASRRAHLRREFLQRVESNQRTRVSAVSDDLSQVQEDIKQIANALKKLQTSCEISPAGNSVGKKCTKTTHGSSSEKRCLPATAFEWPARGSRSTSRPADVTGAQAATNGSGDGKQARAGPPKVGGSEAGSRSEEGSCQQRTHAADGRAEQAACNPRQPEPCKTANAVTSPRGVKRCRASPEELCSSPSTICHASDPHGQGMGTNSYTEAQGSVLCRVEEHVRSRWQHIEPVAMHLFESYRKHRQEACMSGRLKGTDTKHADGEQPSMQTHGQRCNMDSTASPGNRASLQVSGGGLGTGHDRSLSGVGKNSLRLQPWLEAISGDLQAVSRFRSLDLVSVVPTLDMVTQPSRRMVSAVALDRCDHIMAVVGISKPVRLYRFNDICSSSRGVAYAHYPVAELNVRTKPTSACFNPYLQHRLVVSDTEGGVMIMDTNMQHDVMQLEEHRSRVWAVDSSPHDPAMLLSASADRTVRLWRANSENSVGVIAESGQVCSAVFSLTDANLLAVGTSSYARLYDIRRLDMPLGSVAAPKAVSYVRFMGKHFVAAAVDSVLCMYDTEQVANAATLNTVRPLREFRGHLNTRNFVGLACSPSGYILTGSESKSLVMYHSSVPAPVAEQDVVTSDAMAGAGPEATVSCVAVSEALNYVVAGSTSGWVNVMKLTS